MLAGWSAIGGCIIYASIVAAHTNVYARRKSPKKTATLFSAFLTLPLCAMRQQTFGIVGFTLEINDENGCITPAQQQQQGSRQKTRVSPLEAPAICPGTSLQGRAKRHRGTKAI